MTRFGVFFNPRSERIDQIFPVLENLRQNKDLRFFCITDQQEHLPSFIQPLEKPAPQCNLDFWLVFGGDGTILRTVDFAMAAGIPILGVNLGRLGFLTECGLHELVHSVDSLLDGKYNILERMMLKIVLRRNGETIYRGTALNDAVIHKGTVPRLIDIRVHSNRRYVLETRCDGMIASTPTGTTAYSLSSGGPILSPVMEAIVFAPLNPHVLSVRPMVFHASDIIKFTMIRTFNGTLLQLDGRNVQTLRDKDEITISRANRKVQFIKLSNRTFYQILRKKLHMGKG